MFPIANLLKSEVREIARVEGLINVASKKDSTGICFIGKNNFQKFIEEVSILPIHTTKPIGYIAYS